jgi:hypothetical protein
VETENTDTLLSRARAAIVNGDDEGLVVAFSELDEALFNGEPIPDEWMR